MVITINGEIKDVAEGTTVDGLISTLGIRKEGVAVELNREVLPRRLFCGTMLKDGDTLEVIRMVGGG